MRTVPLHRRGIALLRLLCLCAFTACGGGESTPVQPQPVTITAISLSPTSISLVGAGQNATVTATVTSANGLVTSPTVAWTTSNAAVATVSGTGGIATVSSVAAGTAIITARVGGVSATATVTVSASTPAAAIVLNATAATIAQGASGVSTVALTRTNFSGAVAVTVTGAPSGVSASVTNAGDVFTVMLTVGANVAVGNYSLTATASGSGVPSATATIALTVLAAPVTAIALSASPAQLSVQQGATGTSTLTLARTNFSGAVTFTVSNLPAGVTASVSSSQTTGTSVTLTVQVAATAATTTSNVTVVASAAGVASATVTIALTVTPAPVSGGNVTLQFCGQTLAVPIWFAAQDANGGWQRVLPVANNTYRITRRANEGIAYVMETSANNFTTVVRFDALSELIGGCLDPLQFKTVTGTVAGLSATESTAITLGSGFVAVPPTLANPAFTISNVQQGSVDLIATRYARDTTQGIQRANRMILRRSLNPANQSSIGTIDFNNTADGFGMDSTQITAVGGVSSEQINISSLFRTLNGAYQSLGAGSNRSALRTSIVPAAQAISSDLHEFVASSVLITGGDVSTRGVVAQLRNPGTAVTLTLGPQLSIPSVSSVANAPYARFRLSMARQIEYNNFWSIAFSQSTRRVEIMFNDAFLANATTIDAAVPDLSGVTGWQNSWGPAPGAQTGWTVLASQFVLGDQTVGRSATRIGVLR